MWVMKNMAAEHITSDKRRWNYSAGVLKIDQRYVMNWSKLEEDIKDPNCDPDHPVIIPFDDITTAAYKIKTGVYRTPCDRSRLSERYGVEIYFKKESTQFTGNFKERGARFAMLMMDEAAKKKGVVSASAGNHAQAVCYHGHQLGIPVTVVMPVIAPIMKITQCKKFNANVIVQGKDMAEAKKIGLRLAKTNGMMYLNGYDHPHVLAGAGTIGLEILEQVPDLDAIIIPAGGGGMVAGISVAVKAMKPNTKIISVESERCAGFTRSMEAGKPTLVKAEPTLADGLAVPMIGFNAFATARPNVDKAVAVKEESIALAILRLVEEEKCVVEGAGAVGLAAIIEGQIKEFPIKKVVAILSGGNIDTTILGRCLERGLAADGRLVKLVVTVSDRPGGLAELSRLIASIGVSIKDIVHERAWVQHDVFSVDVTVICETRDAQHSAELRDLLKKHYKKVIFTTSACHNKRECV